VRGRRVNEGDEDEGIWVMDFIYLYEETSCYCFKCCRAGPRGSDRGGDLTNVQYAYLELSQ
jgi:hypothetical protein